MSPYRRLIAQNRNSQYDGHLIIFTLLRSSGQCIVLEDRTATLKDSNSDLQSKLNILSIEKRTLTEEIERHRSAAEQSKLELDRITVLCNKYEGNMKQMEIKRSESECHFKVKSFSFVKKCLHK